MVKFHRRLSLVSPKRKEGIIVLNIVATGIPTNCHAFCQITNDQGRVIGRSKVLEGGMCAWPALRMSWDGLHSLKQPLLLAVYSYKGNGQHELLGKVVTNLLELANKANQLGTSHTRKGLPGKLPSFSLLHNQGTGILSLYIPQIQSIEGTPDALSQDYFQRQTRDLARLPSLALVATPPGLQAQSKLAEESLDDTELLTDDSSLENDSYDEDMHSSPLVYSHTKRFEKFAPMETAVNRLLEQALNNCRTGQSVDGNNYDSEVLHAMVQGIREEHLAKQRRISEIRARRASMSL